MMRLTYSAYWEKKCFFFYFIVPEALLERWRQFWELHHDVFSLILRPPDRSHLPLVAGLGGPGNALLLWELGLQLLDGGLPWRTSGQDFAFQCKGLWVPSLATELRPHMPPGQKHENMKKKCYCNKSNKDFILFCYFLIECIYFNCNNCITIWWCFLP